MATNDRTQKALPNEAVSPAESVVLVETAPVTTARKLTRNDVAALMGVSALTVIRREREGLLRAELVDGVHVYDETEVRQTITTTRHRSAMVALGGATGDVAALVFTEMDAGINEVELVKRHAIAPAVVKALVAQYREFRREVTITVEELDSLREELHLARTSAPGATASKRPKCMVCGRAHIVRACAACLAGQDAKAQRRSIGGTDEVRFVVESPEGTSCISDWTPTCALHPEAGP